MTTPFDLSGQTAIVTGANTGIGQGIAVAVARAGGAVVGVGRSSMDDTAARVAALGGSFTPVSCDLADHKAAQAMLDAVVRLIPGVLGNEASTEEESFSEGLLEHPQYTRPARWRDLDIPEVLMSGHHGRIAEWRRAQAEEITRTRRPDLWHALTKGADDS